MTVVDRRALALMAADVLAVTAIDECGQQHYWLFRRDDTRSNHGCCCSDCAPHEQAGALPREVLLALGRQCAGATTTGARCRNLVDAPGARCYVHGGAS